MMSGAADEDLHDVFRVLYADEDDWDMSDEDDHPPLDSFIPQTEDEAEPSGVSDSSEVDVYLTTTYSRKRFRAEIDSLLFPSMSKKRRIFPSASPRLPLYTPSSAPLLPALPSAASFEPYSPLALLARLRTFHPSTYSPAHPSSISPGVLARQGWINKGKDGLECGVCQSRWGVSGLEEILDHRIREEIGRRLASTMRARHRTDCGWSITTSPEGLEDRIRTSLHPPLASSIAPLALRLSTTTPFTLEFCNIVSPLHDKQLAHLLFSLSRYVDLPDPAVAGPSALLALFGWAPHDLSSEILSCRICQRRIGLWSFSQSRSQAQGGGRGLDPINEHLGWCPIRSSEWWKACPIITGKRATVKDLKVSQGVRRHKWLR